LHKAGPFRVVRIDESGSRYTLLNLVTNKEERPCHVSRLSAYHYDESGIDMHPNNVALADVLQFNVEAIRGMKGKFTRLKTLQFLVKWEGYPEEENTWEPWSNLRANAVLHEWLRTHEGGKYASYIPTQFAQSNDTDVATPDEDLLSLNEFMAKYSRW